MSQNTPLLKFKKIDSTPMLTRYCSVDAEGRLGGVLVTHYKDPVMVRVMGGVWVGKWKAGLLGEAQVRTGRTRAELYRNMGLLPPILRNE